MTNIEKGKCEKVCLEGIEAMEEANKLYDEAYKIDKEYHKATISLRRADQKQGYALGINQVLAKIGYNSKSMDELSGLVK